jgi:hypothetical protein
MKLLKKWYLKSPEFHKKIVLSSLRHLPLIHFFWQAVYKFCTSSTYCSISVSKWYRAYCLLGLSSALVLYPYVFISSPISSQITFFL